jgi:glutaredoxin-like YruB-family protein
MADVIIYTTPTCTWCKTAKKFFEEHKIAYKEIDVAADFTKAEEMVRRSGQTGVPVIEIDGEIVVGFDKPKLQELLNLD